MTAAAISPGLDTGDATLPRARVGGPNVAPTAWLVVAAAGALALALRLPVATTVLGLVVFGVLHNVLELRYVTGRFERVLSGPFLWLLGALITAVLVCRLLPVSAMTRGVEIGLCYVILGAACVRALSGRGVWLAASVLVLGAAAVTSLYFPAYHFVVLTHLHNVVPLFFLWEWSRGMAPGPRWGFRTANLGWVVGVPALILAGVLDPLLRAAPVAFGGLGGVAAFEPGRLVASYAPPALANDMGVRFLAVFAFMQAMHYVVWVGLLPRYAPEAAARFDARLPLLRGGRAWLLGIGLALLLGVVFAIDYAQGKTLYAAGASYHAYLEFPVLLALLLAYRPRQPSLGRSVLDPRPSDLELPGRPSLSRSVLDPRPSDLELPGGPHQNQGVPA